MRKTIQIGCSIALGLAVLMYVVSVLASGPRPFCPPAIDSYLYAQAARQIAEGHPFVFTPLDDPSTGTTGHLYPFLLVPGFWLDPSGESIFLYGFLLNVVLYFAFLGGWAVIVHRLVDDVRTRHFAVAMIALSGQALAVATGQTDMGLLMALSAWVFAAWFTNRFRLFAVLLLAAPWCRPEGMMLWGVYCLFLVVRLLLKDCPLRREWVLSFIGFLSVCGVFLFNYSLTGQFQYQSVAHKGYFSLQPFWSALPTFAWSYLGGIRDFILGMDATTCRQYFIFPLLGGVAFLLGLFRYPWKRDWPRSQKIIVFFVCGLGSLALVSTSGYQALNYDRYMAWALPILAVFSMVGISGGSDPKWTTPSLIFSGTLLLFQLVVTVAVFLPQAHRNTLYCGGMWDHNEELAIKSRSIRTFGSSQGASSAFMFANVHADEPFGMFNLSGIYTPRFLNYPLRLNLESIKHLPSARFEAWLFATDSNDFDGVDVSLLTGETVAQTFDGHRVVRSDWSLMDNALKNPVGTNGWVVIDSLDIGFSEDEKAHEYATFCRLPGTRVQPFGIVLTNETETALFEMGRPIIGTESMVVKTQPNRPLRIVLRTSKEALFSVQGPVSDGKKTLTMDSPLNLRVIVDDFDLGVVRLALNENNGCASHLVFDIPADVIHSERSRIQICGDHFSYAYWFLTPSGS